MIVTYLLLQLVNSESAMFAFICNLNNSVQQYTFSWLSMLSSFFLASVYKFYICLPL